MNTEPLNTPDVATPRAAFDSSIVAARALRRCGIRQRMIETRDWREGSQ
jgi:hypothetical protein